MPLKSGPIQIGSVVNGILKDEMPQVWHGTLSGKKSFWNVLTWRLSSPRPLASIALYISSTDLTCNISKEQCNSRNLAGGRLEALWHWFWWLIPGHWTITVNVVIKPPSRWMDLDQPRFVQEISKVFLQARWENEHQPKNLGFQNAGDVEWATKCRDRATRNV